MAEDQMFDDLENMLGGGTAVTKAKAVVKPGAGLSKRGSNSRIVPLNVNDIDDLDDMYNFESKHRVPVKAQPTPTTR